MHDVLVVFSFWFQLLLLQNVYCACTQGALTGGAVSLILNVWLQLGSMSVPNKYPTLPPISVAGCSDHRNSAIFESENGGNCTGIRQLSTTSIGALPGVSFLNNGARACLYFYFSIDLSFRLRLCISIIQLNICANLTSQVVEGFIR